MGDMNTEAQFAKLQGQQDVTNTKLESTNKAIEVLGKNIDELRKEMRDAIFSPEGINKRLSVTYDIVVQLKNDRETDRSEIMKTNKVLESHEQRLDVVENDSIKRKTLINFLIFIVSLVGLPLVVQVIRTVFEILSNS